jgi:proline iminopeptidase
LFYENAEETYFLKLEILHLPNLKPQVAPMKKLIILLNLIFTTCIAHSQQLYSKAFGNTNNRALIFIHGGPSSSSVYFEATTAQKLANQGFYVVIYDRRGEGRSVDPAAKITYKEAFTDLNSIYKKYKLTKATLIGFSFGGLVTTLFTQKYPKKVNAIVLVSSLISQQESYNTILRTTKLIYQKEGDTTKANQISKIELMDKNSVEYRDSTYKHATRNGFFTLEHPNSLAKAIYATYNTDTTIIKYVKNEESVHTFWKNEKLKNIDISPMLSDLRSKGISIYALYGRQDGLYSIHQIGNLQKIVGLKHFIYIDNCSHTVFIDQQDKFISYLTRWLK